MNHTAKAIKQLRKDHDLTQADLAKLLKTTSAFVSLIENGRSKLPLYMARKIVKKYYYLTMSVPIRYALCKDAIAEIDKDLGL